MSYRNHSKSTQPLALMPLYQSKTTYHPVLLQNPLAAVPFLQPSPRSNTFPCELHYIMWGEERWGYSLEMSSLQTRTKSYVWLLKGKGGKNQFRSKPKRAAK
ncbi:D(1) dopamine receptor-like [Platysternon megacephalum]|uniref:D(1) dopamine receptor-like n=1 Tax=Platysternon megacephalum TaxID=55544 RepID=A0A4D9ELF2_9SAUR|nr:D(1) dopamine receptor-like [Platysternon megacephalum]